MRRAIIHIGLEKTGSTFVQDFFSLNKSTIKKHGLYYSKCLTGKNHARMVLLGQEGETTANKVHRWVGLEPRDVRPANHLWLEEVKAEESGGHAFWASSEFLSSMLLHRESCSRFIGNLRLVFDEVSVVLFVRKQEDLLISRYSTSVLDGNHRAMRIDRVPREVDVLSILERWDGLPDLECLHVLPYFSDVGARELIEILLARTTAIEPDLSRFDWPEGKVNPRLTFSGLEAIRRVNERYGSIPPVKRSEVLALLASHTKHEQRFTLSGSRFQEASEKFAGVNKEIALRLAEADRERFLKPTKAEVTIDDVSYDPKLVGRLEEEIVSLIPD